MGNKETKLDKKEPFFYLVLVRLTDGDEIDGSLFSKEENEAIHFYKRKEDQLLKATSLLLLSSYLPKPIFRNKYGKPFLIDGPYFSFSHSYPYVALVVNSSPIGVDVEVTKPWDERMDETCFSKEDKSLNISPLRLWTLKEACYKSDGDHSFEPKEEKIKILSAKALQVGNTIKYYLFLGDNNKELTIVSNSRLDELEISSLTYLELRKQRRTNYGSN